MTIRPNWNENPFIVIWEVTRACALACRHCRAEAVPHRHPMELNTEQGRAFIDQVVAANPGIFILTGGDPMSRPDLLDLVHYASSKGLRVAMSPSGTARFAHANLKAFANSGLQRISMSLDGASKESHDTFRGVKGTWEWTMAGIKAAKEAGIEVQINTTITRGNLGEFDQFVKLLEEIQPVLWSVFQLVPTGRAKMDDLLNAQEMEDLFIRMADLAQTVPYDIKTTEGQHYRRVAWQRWKERGGSKKPSPIGVNDGKGFVFVSHTGEVFPSGFLPLCAGSVRQTDLLTLYRNSPIFKQLRDPDALKGKCRRCEFRSLCGGSRARSYALTGDFLAQEALCAYQPAAAPEPEPIWRMNLDD